MYLAIETSSDTASLVLAEEGEILAELNWRCAQSHTTTLLPNLDNLLKQSGLDLTAITAVIVSQGPGSYNGLRVGISTAKALAFSLNIPVVGIDSLEALAYQHAEAGLPVCAIVNAGRNEIAAAIYQMKEPEFREILGTSIITLADLCQGIDTKTIFCGEITAPMADEIGGMLGEVAVIPSPAASVRRAAFLVELGYQRIESGRLDTPAGLAPIYLRKPHITKPNRNKKTMVVSNGD